MLKRTLQLVYVPQGFAWMAEKCVRILCWTLKIAVAGWNTGKSGGL